MMNRLVYALAVLAPPLFPQSEVPSFVNEGIVNAPIAAVWRVWTTGEGYRAVGVALADVDLRIGGLIRSRYSAAGVLGDDETIVQRILAYEPGRMMRFASRSRPSRFPSKRRGKLRGRL